MRQLVVVCILSCLVQTLSAQTPMSFAEFYLGDDSTRMYYRVGGEGPPLLLVHGFGASGAQWDPFVSELSAHRTLVIPDLPGHGRSRLPLDHWEFGEAVAQVTAVLDEVGYSSVDAIGHSAGATTLLQLALADSTRIHAMVLISQAHRLPQGARDQARVYPSIDELPADFRNSVVALHPGGADQFTVLIEQLRTFADNYNDFDVSPEHLGVITVPTLLIVGDKDPYYGIDVVGELYTSLPTAALWVIPEQGHFPFWPMWGGSPADAQRFPGIVLDFLDAANAR